MNQTLKDKVYGKGTRKQLMFLAKCGGMNEEQVTLMLLAHDGKSDSCIEDMMNISKDTRKRIEDAIAAKLAIAVFHCIDVTMDCEGE